MRAPILWAGGLAGSLLAHVAFFAVFDLSVQPDPTPTQPKPETRMQMDAYQVDRERAQPQKPDADAASQTQADTTDLKSDAIPQSRADAQTPEADKQAAQPPQAPDAPAQTPDAQRPTAKAPPSQAAAPLQAQITPAAPVSAPTSTAVAQAPAAQNMAITRPDAAKAEPITARSETTAPLAAAPEQINRAELTSKQAEPLNAPTQQATSLNAPTKTADSLDAPAQTAPQSAPVLETAALAAPPNAPAPTLTAPSAASPEQTPDAPEANQPPLPADYAKAALAWNFGDRVVTDPDALATIQAFMAPQTLDGSQEVRDDLASLLTSVDCARLSATFIPETGALELRGHVPDNALRGPVLQALQAQIGDGITVTDNLRHLPKPQCGALSGIADIGLPQSTDQLTNKRLIGDNAQAVEFTYSEGQSLSFDMQSPDYAAVVYVDYFDAGGQVIHLVPNDVVPLSAYGPKESVGIERGDGPRLNITIGPPYGQEIAVAFASSEPLYEGTRPIIEPAAPYLEFLQARVAQARENDPDFKGEWVYFFITTQPATQ